MWHNQLLQMAAEARAREAAQKGIAKRAQQAEARGAALVDTVQVRLLLCSHSQMLCADWTAESCC